MNCADQIDSDTNRHVELGVKCCTTVLDHKGTSWGDVVLADLI